MFTWCESLQKEGTATVAISFKMEDVRYQQCVNSFGQLRK